MVRTVDYEHRRRAVLAAVINRYIKNAEPVASEVLAREFDLSSATIRNIFAELEESGYLMHPYTSGGKIPTNKGYRYYVDSLISQIELLEDEKERIVREYKKQIHKLEYMLETTTEVVSVVTHYTSIVSLLEWHDRFYYKGISFILEQPEFQDSNHIRLLIGMLEDKRRLIDVINRDFEGKVKIYIGTELGCAEMKNCSLAVSRYRVNDKPSGRVAVLGPMRMEYRHTISALEYVSDVLSQVLNGI
jgi:transcriptional regulator of heat shock response